MIKKIIPQLTFVVLFVFSYTLYYRLRVTEKERDTDRQSERFWSAVFNESLLVKHDLWPVKLGLLLKGVVYNSAESLLIFELSSQTNTPLSSVLLQTPASNAQH